MKESSKTGKRVVSARKKVIDAQQRIDRQTSVSPEDYHEKVALKAYELFESRGYQHGFHLDDWFEAERLIQKESHR